MRRLRGHGVGGAVAFDDAYVVDVGMLGDRAGDGLVHFVVGLHDGEGDIALALSEKARGGNVDVEDVQTCCNVGEHAFRVALLDDDAVVFAA